MFQLSWGVSNDFLVESLNVALTLLVFASACECIIWQWIQRKKERASVFVVSGCVYRLRAACADAVGPLPPPSAAPQARANISWRAGVRVKKVGEEGSAPRVNDFARGGGRLAVVFVHNVTLAVNTSGAIQCRCSQRSVGKMFTEIQAAATTCCGLYV